jgi:hypothetical protein
MFYKYILSTLLVAIFLYANAPASDGLLGTEAYVIEDVCGITGVPEQVQFGGVHLPAEGTIRALVVFVQFPDDQLISANWPLNQMPTYAGHYIDSEVLPTPTPNSITDYYHVMSNGRLHLIGDVYPNLVITPHSRDWYIDFFNSQNYGLNERFGFINREVLVSIDNSVDYGLYDNWTKSGGVFVNEPDGKVEMVILVYRNHSRDYPVAQWGEIEKGLGVYFWGIALLGYSSSTPDIITDGVRIEMNSFPGSGLMYKNGFFDDAFWNGNYGFKLGLAAHEFGHYLWGSGHPTSQNIGIMGGTNLATNSIERERMGWLQFTDLSEPNVTIPDFVTQNTALRMQLDGTSCNPPEN